MNPAEQNNRHLTEVVSQKFAELFADKPYSRHAIFLFENPETKDLFVVPDSGYKTLNEWFARDIKPDVLNCLFQSGICASCESMLKVYRDIDPNNLVQVKGKNFKLTNLLLKPDASKKDRKRIDDLYGDGFMALYRLRPKDAHGIYHSLDGEIMSVESFDGTLFPVNGLGLYSVNNLFCKNKRDVVFVETDLGTVAYVDIGALNVGSIKQFNKKGDEVHKGAKKANYYFGGSTTIVFFEEGKVDPLPDFGENEKYTFVGQRIGDIL